MVLRFLASDLEMVSILLTDEWLSICKADLERRPEPVRVYRAPPELVKSIVGYNYHQGIMAVGRVPPKIELSKACDIVKPPRLFVALDGIGNTENVGVIIRNCAACGVGAVLSGETSVDPYLRRSVRNSMGAVFRIPVVYCESLAETIGELREKYGFSIIAAHLQPHSVPIYQVDFTNDCCIIFGNEQYGVSHTVVSRCNVVTAIPMHAGVDSFNVACASAIILHEAFRQRNSMLSHQARFSRQFPS